MSPLQADVLKTSDTGGFVEQHGISAQQMDTGYTGCSFRKTSVSQLVGQLRP